MKNRTKLPNVYLGFLLALMYVPILLVILYSFNESKLSSVWGGFSLKWYAELFRDRDLFQALWNSIVLGVISSCSAAVIGTLGAYGMSKVNFPLKGVVEYVSTLAHDDTRDYYGHGVHGVLLPHWHPLWHGDVGHSPHGLLHPLCVHAGEGPAGGHGQELAGGRPGLGRLAGAGVLRRHLAPGGAGPLPRACCWPLP